MSISVVDVPVLVMRSVRLKKRGCLCLSQRYQLDTMRSVGTIKDFQHSQATTN